jgi:hypothetical protein
MISIGEALKRPEPAPEPSASHEASQGNDRTLSLVEFVLRRFPSEQAEFAVLALMGDDPEHDAEWWAQRIERLIQLEDPPEPCKLQPEIAA